MTSIGTENESRLREKYSYSAYFSFLYFPVFRLNAKIFRVNLLICSKHSFWWKCLEDVFSVTFFYLPRRLEDMFARRLLVDVLKTSWRRRFANTPWRRLQRRLKNVLKTSKTRIAKTSSRSLENLTRRWNLIKWNTVTLKTSSWHFQDASEIRNICWD